MKQYNSCGHSRHLQLQPQLKNIKDCNKLVSIERDGINSLASVLPVIEEARDLSLASYALPPSFCLWIVFSSYHLVTFGYNHPKWSHDCLAMDLRRDTRWTSIHKSTVGFYQLDQCNISHVHNLAPQSSMYRHSALSSYSIP